MSALDELSDVQVHRGNVDGTDGGAEIDGLVGSVEHALARLYAQINSREALWLRDRIALHRLREAVLSFRDLRTPEHTSPFCLPGHTTADGLGLTGWNEDGAEAVCSLCVLNRALEATQPKGATLKEVAP